MEIPVKTTVSLVCLILLASLTAGGAEIEKVAQICQTGICLYWWPKLPKIEGWHQDQTASMQFGVNALAPDGFIFTNAVAVMYANASYKPRDPETKSMQMFIAADERQFEASERGVQIAEVKPLMTADGKLMRSFTFFPKSRGNWEQVAYGDEGEYYLTFVLSSKSKTGFQDAEGAYRELIAHYKEKM